MLSYVRGPEATLLDATIPQALAGTAGKFPNRDALIVRHQNVRLTWRELHAEVERTARGLAGLGLEPGDRVGIWASSCLEWVLVQLGCARAGLVLVNVNPACRSHELAFVLRKSRMRALVLRESDARADYRQILGDAMAGRNLPLQHIVWLGHESWEEMLAAGRDSPPMPVDANDVVNIQYTSGTTGAPKGVLLTHRGILNNAALMCPWLHLTEQDRFCMPLPLYHCSGCVLGVLGSIASGAVLILPSAGFDALATLQAIHEERATVTGGVPTMFIAQLEHPEFGRFDLTSLRGAFMGGAPCPLELMKRLVTNMHIRETGVVYGMTEASPIITLSHPDDSMDARVSTVGRAVPCVEVKIVSTATGETLPAGEQGELCTRGYHVMKGYDDEPEATAKAIDADGWLHTGDLGVMLASGHFKITGRAKEMLIRGGENIYPREIEEFLFAHPKIADVAVVGLPDRKLGEAVLAWIRLKAGESATEEEIREYCDGRLAHFKIPQHIRFAEAFPMTVTGKVQKFRIREIEIEQRGLQAAASIETA